MTTEPTQEELTELALKVPCRRCKVDAGEPCVNSITGEGRELPHLVREDAGLIAAGMPL